MDEDEKKTQLIIKSRPKNNFSMVENNGFIRDTQLTLADKGLLTLLQTNKEDWRIYLEEVSRHSKNGITAHRTALQHLIDCKYVRKTTEREKGKFLPRIYEVFDRPYDGTPIPHYQKSKTSATEDAQEEPLLEKPPVEIPPVVKSKVITPPMNNQTLTNNNYNNIKKTKLTNSVGSESSFTQKIKSLFEGSFVFDDGYEAKLKHILFEKEIGEKIS